MSLIGRTVSHYSILEELGEGGMGVVYKAEDIKLKRTVALKFLKSEILGTESDRARFIQEAQVAARLEHPNICTVYEIDERDGQAFIAMAYCAGRSLKEQIKEGPLSVPEALGIAVQAAEGLEEAHAKGIIHRDIKSANIIVSARGQVKIMDFGIAKLAEKAQSTWSGTVVGTVAYMSPEQARGEPVDARTDIWSLGVVLYEMLTQKTPFKGETDAAVIHSLLYEPPKPFGETCPECPPELEGVVRRCLEKDPARRYPSVRELREDLQALKRRYEGTAAMPAAPVSAWKSPERKRGRAIAVAAGGLIIVALLVSLLNPTARRSLARWADLRRLPAQKHVAVLPFRNLGPDPADQRFCDGLVEILVSRLTQLERYQAGLWIVPTSEVLEFGIVSAAKARSAFGATLAFAGSSQRQEGDIVLTLNLIDAATLRQVRSEVFMTRPENTLAFQDGIVLRSAEMLGIDLPAAARRELTMGGTITPGANQFYVQGLGYLEHYENEKDLDAAIELFKRAINLDATNALVHAGLGEAYWKKYDLTRDQAWAEAARESCRRAAGINPDLVPVLITLGIIAAGTGRTEEALREFEKALRKDPESFEATLGYARAFEAAGKPAEAEEVYRRAIRLDPSRWAGYSQLGAFYYGSGRWAEAERMFQQVVRLAPDNYRGYNNLMGIYYLMGKDGLVREMFERSIFIKPNADAYSNFGTILFFQGRYGEAVRSFEEAIGLGRDTYEIWGNLADCYRYTPGYGAKAKEAYQKALALAEKELRVNPQEALLLARMAYYYAMSGEPKKALAALLEAWKILPGSVLILKKCVQVKEKLGRRTEALEALKEYLMKEGPLEEIEKDPDLSELRKDPGYEKTVAGVRAGKK